VWHRQTAPVAKVVWRKLANDLEPLHPQTAVTRTRPMDDRLGQGPNLVRATVMRPRATVPHQKAAGRGRAETVDGGMAQSYQGPTSRQAAAVGRSRATATAAWIRTRLHNNDKYGGRFKPKIVWLRQYDQRRALMFRQPRLVAWLRERPWGEEERGVQCEVRTRDTHVASAKSTRVNTSQVGI
jgi:hypothetical protein